jgi:hypothetical protein
VVGQSLYISKRIDTGYWSADYSGHLGGTQINHSGIFGLSEELIRDTWTRVLSQLLFFDACSVTAQCPLPKTISI